jgi:hypothetical protein
MSSSPQALTAAYQACLNEAFRQCPLLIHRWCNGLVDTLYERYMSSSQNVEKHHLQDAISALKKNQTAIEQGFALELTQAMASDTQSDAGKKADKSVRSLSSLSFDDLELMGDNQVQDTVDSARLVQIVSIACEAGLAGLSARLSTAQGFKQVKSDTNPLRPEIVSQALLKLLQDVPADNAVRSLWLIHGAQLMGRELQALYVLLNDQLIEQGVAPAAYGVISSPGAGPTSTGRHSNAVAHDADQVDFSHPVDTSGQPHAPVHAGAASRIGAVKAASPGGEALLTLDHLHRLLAGDYDDSFTSQPPPLADFKEAAQQKFAHTVPAAMDVLAELTQKGIATTRAKKARTVPPLPLAQMRAQLKLEAKSLGQSLAIEVVSMMIEQMANDQRLLAPVRQIIANAEPAFLRLGVTDPRFFSDRAHPARCLLEAITAKSLAYSSETAAGFTDFLQDLQDVAALLTEEDASDAQHFATLLESFEKKLALRSSGNMETQRRAVQALLQAEQRNLMAEKIATEILARPDFVGGNRIVTAFLTGPWAQVLAKERLLGELDGGTTKKVEFSLTLGEVLWSLDAAQTMRHRKRLAKIIPGILQSLRAGLLSIDYPLAQSKEFFDELMVIHQITLKAKSELSDFLATGPNTRSRSRRDLEEAFDANDTVHSRRPWLAPSEAQHSGFMDDVEPSAMPHFQPTQPFTQETSHQRPVAEVTRSAGAELRLGAWVELFSEDKWLRAQLTWISPYNTLFMFTSDGGRTHSMTGPLLEYLLLQDLVKIISQQGVLDGALDTVARTAMHNSVMETTRF